MNALESPSTRPYLIRALYEWCTDNGFTPYVAVLADDTVQVPREYVKDGEIVLNISFDATSALKLGNEFIEFRARFAGTAREIIVPVNRVVAIYARENGQGMAFPTAAPSGAQEAPPRAGAQGGASSVAEEPRVVQLVTSDTAAAEDGDPPRPPSPVGGPRPSLKRIK
ncbi:ClpXP protease specificity-enhancing factor [Ramlibacter sp. H39-3-26]|uniref:ClpXP protease specificity-enhancing factor n=1 Tax=Curvibacter soli TaxID=3031331 RepID=UPI0023DA76C9|nr:ClpXP protease specificity-enhancing factor [Ramlibacter sp. H39-3-26]MDF1486674.1 ClpXP protease specificity-enhancing factor [Ramlibacter sp. H39-3-26]